MSKNILKKFFSISNEGIYKKISFIGINFKIKSKNLIIKEQNIQIKNNNDYLTVQVNYQKVLNKLKEKIKKEKLRVVFYTNETQKWSYDSVYKEFENSPYFDPLIIVVPRYRVHKGKDNTANSIEEQYNFYQEKGYNVEYGYRQGKYIDIKTFEPDIFFYLQLAEIPNIDDPVIISEYALTAYCPYAYMITNHSRNYLQRFHKLLYVHFTEHDINNERYNLYKIGNILNCKTTGHPKLDIYLKETKSKPIKTFWKEPEKFKIIYAPHHSFQKNGDFCFSTFPYNYKFILEIAKKYSHKTTWLFKPHPLLKYKILQENLMNEKEVEEYYNEWNKIGSFYNSGDYFDIFKTSDLMITDCASFLMEYLPSTHPLIRLRNKNSLSLNDLGEKCTSEYYNAYNNEDLEQLINEIAIKNNDYKKESRLKLIDDIFDKQETSAHKIYEFFYNQINTKL